MPGDDATSGMDGGAVGISRLGWLIGAALGLLGVSLPAPAHACSRAYLIFFDRGVTAITARAGQIAQEFVALHRNRRPATEEEKALPGLCLPLPPGEWRFVVAAHAQ